MILACTVEGERAATGECTEGEVCSKVTPDGLNFLGTSFYDESGLRLGPLLVEGSLDVGLQNPGGALPDFEIQAESGGAFSADLGQGVFGPTDSEGRPLLAVDAFVTLQGLREGETYLRITDPATGELMDRLNIQTYEITDVAVTNAGDPDRDHLLAGCDQMIGVHLLANDGEVEVRAFDQDVEIRTADGMTFDEPQFWDCVNYEVPEDAEEVLFYVDAVGKTYERTLPVRTLRQEALLECPVARRD